MTFIGRTKNLRPRTIGESASTTLRVTGDAAPGAEGTVPALVMTLMATAALISSAAAVFAAGLTNGDVSAHDPAARAATNDRIKSFCIDFNWGAGGPNGFPAPGTFAQADPKAHYRWYRDLGVNTIQTFCVSCNGYSWYQGSAVTPVQPGLKHDFLKEMTDLAHADGVKVMGYFCVGANTYWGQQHPEQSYGIPSGIHIPLTNEYLDYLAACIKDALSKTGIDGFMIDWVFSAPLLMGEEDVRWLACEQTMYAELFGRPFPGRDTMDPGATLEFQRRALERCWRRIHEAAKAAKPDCVIWLSCFDLSHPQVVGTAMFREVDWVMNETPTPEKIEAVRQTVGPHTKLIQCVSGGSMNYDASKVLADPRYQDMGLYGFAPWPDPQTTLPPDPPQDSTQKNIQANIEKLRRVYRSPASAVSPEVKLARPTPIQYAWHEQERIQFVCLDPCTWQGREFDNHSTPLSAINPAQLDTDQWCRSAKLWGAKEILFVAKHTGGFCWWQTETSNYGIKETAWKNGKGDVLAELSASCRRHALNLGVYVYPGDDTWGAPIGSGGRTKDPAKQEAYNQVFRQQLTEVLTRYGKMTEVWFDGSCVIDVSDILKQHAADAVIFQGPQATIRWPGTESGRLPYPAWNSLSSKDLKTGVATTAHGNPDGDAWAPLEADTTLYNHNWFWAAANEKKRKSLDELMDIYYKSAGHGGVLLLNSTPSTNGLIPADDLKLYEAFGQEIERRFGRPLAEIESQRGGMVELPLSHPALINHAVIMEDYREGERIREYVLEGFSDGQWRELKRGKSVGRKKIDLFRPARVSRMRLHVTQFAAEPIIGRLAAFYVEGVSAGSLTTGRPTTASAFHSAPYIAPMATDDHMQTRWGCPDGTTACWLEVDLGAPTEFGRLELHELADRIRKFTLQYRNDSNLPWQSALEGERVGARYERDFPAVTGRFVRLNVTEASGPPTLWEFSLHPSSGSWQRCGTWTAESFLNDHAALTLDLSPFIIRPGQFEVKFEQTGGQHRLRVTEATLFYEGEEATPGLLTRLADANVFNINRTAQVTAETSSVLKVVITVDGGEGCNGTVWIRPRPTP